jgi:hypothetical protein
LVVGREKVDRKAWSLLFMYQAFDVLMSAQKIGSQIQNESPEIRLHPGVKYRVLDHLVVDMSIGNQPDYILQHLLCGKGT